MDQQRNLQRRTRDVGENSSRRETELTRIIKTGKTFMNFAVIAPEPGCAGPLSAIVPSLAHSDDAKLPRERVDAPPSALRLHACVMKRDASQPSARAHCHKR